PSPTSRSPHPKLVPVTLIKISRLDFTRMALVSYIDLSRPSSITTRPYIFRPSFC
ncbi:unnamed protein product, partial [Dovyalis caffra]